MPIKSPVRATDPLPGPAAGTRGRTYRLLLGEAMKLAEDGRLVSVAEVAAAAGVSRATAYRYFASRGELISAMVGESLGPVRRFESRATDGRERVQELFTKTFPRFRQFEAHMRAALQLSLEHWALERSGRLTEEPYRRGHRVAILKRIAAPLKSEMPEREFRRLLRALSMIFGIEPYVVLKDIWGSSDREVQATARWMADALIDAALKVPKRAKRNPGDRRVRLARAVV
ncbi:MAG: TetR family transcriptional regulator [Burkholderiaceae bacterium]|nr:TetR family transcriptional regulator [Burkholderiaceae bacterium]